MQKLALTQAPLAALAAYVLASACTPFFDTEIPDTIVRLDDVADEDSDVDDARGDADTTDAGDADGTTDARDTAEELTAELDEPTLLEPNRCGGERPLILGGERMDPGAACGCGGSLVCNGLEALYCAGATPPNLCGGCGELPGDPGGGCGKCGDGVFICDGGQMRCEGAGFGNLCGGCERLAGAPGAPCDAEVTSKWICKAAELVECEPSGSQNACGGLDALEYGGLEAEPGEACEASCGAGVLVCDVEAQALRCEGPALNACGGCGDLDGVPGGTCGCDGSGRWECGDDGAVACEGGAPNACGGCAPLSQQPGLACGSGGVRVCVSPTLTTCLMPGVSRNACGGVDPLPALLGSPCGSCNSGVTVCAGPDEVACAGDRGLRAFNGCGGCLSLGGLPDDACGVCGAGRVACDGEESLRCDGNPGPSARNACGGCSELPGTPGESCGGCAVWRCSGGSLQCAVDVGDPTCVQRALTCADLSCGELSRACIEGVGGADARCGGCVAGHVDRDGACVRPLRCTDLSCAASNRVCVEGVGGADATCAGCTDGYVERAGACVEESAECTVDGDCPPEIGSWSECDFADVCATHAQRSRAVVPRTCSAGSCVLGALTFEREDCTPRETDGQACGVSSVCAGGECLAAGPSLGAVCTEDSQCPTDAWCPTETSERRCSPNPTVGGVSFPFQYVPSGTFTMGSPTDELGRSTIAGREDLHDVELTRAYFMQRTEVTQAQWRAVVGNNPAHFNRNGGCTTESTCPVEQVNWWESVAYANLLSSSVGISDPDHCYVLGAATGDALGSGCSGTTTSCSSPTYRRGSVTFRGLDCSGYRLPTEAEWERAYRAVTTTTFYNGPITETGSGLDPNLDAIGWYTYNSGSRTRSVGGKAANSWGLYDMSGNVREWVSDWYSATYYGASPSSDPLGPASGSSRVSRGGFWGNSAENCRSAARDLDAPVIRHHFLGLRLARTAPAATCDDLACDDADRDCVVVDGSASCSDCLPGYEEVDGACLAAGPSLGDVCTEDGQCPVDSWCPTETSERRCSPHPTVGGVTFAFQYIPSGTFPMGSPTNEPGRSTVTGDEDLHNVELTRAYFMQRTEVTQAQWRAVVGNNPAYFNADGTCADESTCPVERVNWWESVAYANALSNALGITEANQCYALGAASGDALGSGCSGIPASCNVGTYTRSSVTFRGLDCLGYRLPTEAEWERAYRGGTATPFYNGAITQTGSDLDPNLDAIGWYSYNSGSRTRQVGGKASNAWGLYDMSGNVYEWVWNWYSSTYYGSSPASDPLGPSSGSLRVHRGSYWEGYAQHSRAAFRGSDAPVRRGHSIGLRLARTVLP